MTWPEIYLLCFAVGGLWSLVTVLGGAGFLSHLHIGHGHGGHGHAHVHHGHAANPSELASFFGSMLHPSGLAIFLAWFGAAGYLLTRHTLLGTLLTLAGSSLLGLLGMLLLGYFLRWLQKAEKPLDPADYRVTGILGRVSCPIREGGIGELIYLRDGSRSALPAKSEDGAAIPKGEEVVVTRYEKGIAYVKTWDSFSEGNAEGTSSAQKEEVQ